MIVYNRNIQIDSIKEKHIKNNKEIFTKIMNFMKHNNLTPEDFFVGGSSCCSYMNYFILNEARDIDIFLIKDIEVERTEGIDVIPYSATVGYKPELIGKDGIYFLAPESIAIDCALKMLLRRKRQTRLYLKLLLDYMGMTVDEFQERFEKEFEKHLFNYNDKSIAIQRVIDNMYLLQIWCETQVVPDYLKNPTGRGIIQGEIPTE